MSRKLNTTPHDKRDGHAHGGRVLLDTIESRHTFTSRTTATPAERGMKDITFPVPSGLQPYRAVVLGRPRGRAYRLCLTPTPIAVPRRATTFMIERPLTEDMEYMVAWLVDAEART